MGMPRLGWVTDIHLDWLDRSQRFRFYESLRGENLAYLLIGGDIGLAGSLELFLEEIEEEVDAPIYFVLGNHDFYGSSIASVRYSIRRQAAKSRRLVWLSAAGVVRLGETTALVGHDSWADGRCGDFLRSNVLLNDYVFIEELSVVDEIRRLGAYDKQRLLKTLHRLGDEAAEYIRHTLDEALAACRQAIVLTHVPPFRESCWHEGRISGDDFLPHFTCRVFGEALLEVMEQHPDRSVTVLCGHTHGSGFAQIRDNLEVWTGGAEYGKPVLQRIFEV
jgi:Icc-related predicted phosphoesterase